jgi:hypothetical protein
MPRVVGTAHQAAATSTFLNMAWESLMSRLGLHARFRLQIRVTLSFSCSASEFVSKNPTINRA